MKDALDREKIFTQRRRIGLAASLRFLDIASTSMEKCVRIFPMHWTVNAHLGSGKANGDRLRLTLWQKHLRKGIVEIRPS